MTTKNQEVDPIHENNAELPERCQDAQSNGTAVERRGIGVTVKGRRCYPDGNR